MERPQAKAGDIKGTGSAPWQRERGQLDKNQPATSLLLFPLPPSLPTLDRTRCWVPKHRLSKRSKAFARSGGKRLVGWPTEPLSRATPVSAISAVSARHPGLRHRPDQTDRQGEHVRAIAQAGAKAGRRPLINTQSKRCSERTPIVSSNISAVRPTKRYLAVVRPKAKPAPRATGGAASAPRIPVGRPPNAPSPRVSGPPGPLWEDPRALHACALHVFSLGATPAALALRFSNSRAPPTHHPLEHPLQPLKRYLPYHTYHTHLSPGRPPPLHSSALGSTPPARHRRLLCVFTPH